MNIITIGDLHGSSAWKTVRTVSCDRIIFTGDYVDSFDYEDEEIMDNLLSVIGFKKGNPEKVILLWGNHDVAYLFRGKSPHVCSGFRYDMAPDLFNLFYKNRNLFQTAWQVENYLWSHAGIVQSWFSTCLKNQILTLDTNLSGTLNRLFDEYYLPLFHVGPVRGGRDKMSGPFWADMYETSSDPLTGYHQIVGHSRTGKGTVSIRCPDGKTSVTYTDCLDTEISFFELKLLEGTLGNGLLNV